MQFYVFNIFYSIISFYIYGMFRFGVEDNLRYRRCSKSYIKKSLKGVKNYWTYARIHGDAGLGCAYRLNLALLVLTPAYFVFAVLFGWIRLMQLPVAILSAVICTVQVPAMFFAEVYYNLENYGEEFVLYRRRKNFYGYDSSVVDIAAILAIAAFAVYNFTII